MTSTNELKYKGFTASVEFSAEDMMLIGKVDHVESLIVFAADNAQDLAAEFHAAIEGYLEHCASQNVEPEKPCKGTFNVRVGADLHRRAASIARAQRTTLNDFVKAAVQGAVDLHAETAVASQLAPPTTKVIHTPENIWGSAGNLPTASIKPSRERYN
jgi:predicted HicB family RNase H-like nuclease